MIYLHKFEIFVKNPSDKFDKAEINNYIYENLDKGLLAFVLPEDISEADKTIKSTYKVGFLYDMLTIYYPMKGKQDKHHVISEKYDMWFTYRQFHNILKNYEKDRNKYLFKRSLLIQN